MAAAERVADKLSYLLIAPPDHSQREVSGTLAQSLFHTCRQPKIPGVADPLDYKPAKPLITQIQADFDEEMASGH
jgi:hypothetical protein